MRATAGTATGIRLTIDYYSCWAFQFYAPLWNVWYGYEHLPKIAAAFEEHSHALMKTYPQFFD